MIFISIETQANPMWHIAYDEALFLLALSSFSLQFLLYLACLWAVAMKTQVSTPLNFSNNSLTPGRNGIAGKHFQFLHPFHSENQYNCSVPLMKGDLTSIFLCYTLRFSTTDLIITINLTPFDVEVEQTALSISAGNYLTIFLS